MIAFKILFSLLLVAMFGSFIHAGLAKSERSLAIGMTIFLVLFGILIIAAVWTIGGSICS